jgi:hypothetical protein
MDTSKGDQSVPQVQDHAGSDASKAAPPSEPNDAAPPALALAEVPDMAPAPAAPAVVAAPVNMMDAPPAAPAVEAPKLDMADADPVVPSPADVRPADMRAEETIAPAVAASRLSSMMPSIDWAKARRLAPLAASIAVAAVLGAIAGSITIAGLGLGSPSASATVAPTADARALKESVARLHAEIAALKASTDASAKSAAAHLIKLGDRLDRVEKAQAEPAARLAKLTEAVDRIERRAPTNSTAAHDITGSVAAYAPAPPPTVAEAASAAGPPVLEGWSVRSVYNGAALIQGRLGGVMEVEPGDNLPGLGRIETIRRQNGRWVVVTSKGLIVAR